MQTLLARPARGGGWSVMPRIRPTQVVQVQVQVQAWSESYQTCSHPLPDLPDLPDLPCLTCLPPCLVVMGHGGVEGGLEWTFVMERTCMRDTTEPGSVGQFIRVCCVGEGAKCDRPASQGIMPRDFSFSCSIQNQGREGKGRLGRVHRLNPTSQPTNPSTYLPGRMKPRQRKFVPWPGKRKGETNVNF